MIDFNQPIAPAQPVPDPAATRPPEPARDLSGMPLSALLTALNHLLQQQSWARDRLKMYAGMGVRLGVTVAGPPSLCATITSDGLFEPGPDRPAQATLWLRPSVGALFDGLRGGARGLAPHLQVEGDVMLAGTLGELAQHLRWDAEEDLSHWVGDIAAHRIADFMRRIPLRAAEVRNRVESAAVQFATVEQPQLVTRQSLQARRQELAQLAERIDALAGRVAGVERARR